MPSSPTESDRASSNKIYRYETKTCHSVPEYGKDVQTTWPGEWFDKNKKKPPVTMYEDPKPDQLTSIRKACSKVTETISADTAVMFLQYFIKNDPRFQETLTEDWTSFNQKIGVVGETITPLNLLSSARSAPSKADGTQTVNEIDDSLLFIKLLAPYRIYRSVDEGGYRDRITDLIGNISRQDPFSAGTDFDVTQGASNMRGTIENVDYKRMVAAIDMFMRRFPSNAMSSIRVCTISSRFMDCAIVDSLHQVAKAAGLLLSDLVTYVLTSEVETQIVTLLDKLEELDQPNSFTPYMREFGLVERSPVSSVACPDLYVWLHSMGCGMRCTRSYNAKLLDCSGVQQTLLIGIITGVILSGQLKIKKRFRKANQTLEERKAEKQYLEEIDDKTTDTSRTPEYVMQEILELQDDPDVKKKYSRLIRERLVEPAGGFRPGTIGKAIFDSWSKN